MSERKWKLTGKTMSDGEFSDGDVMDVEYYDSADGLLEATCKIMCNAPNQITYRIKGLQNRSFNSEDLARAFLSGKVEKP